MNEIMDQSYDLTKLSVGFTAYYFLHLIASLMSYLAAFWSGLQPLVYLQISLLLGDSRPISPAKLYDIDGHLIHIPVKSFGNKQEKQLKGSSDFKGVLHP